MRDDSTRGHLIPESFDFLSVIFLSAFLLFTGLWWGNIFAHLCEAPSQNQRPVTQQSTEQSKPADLTQSHAQGGNEETGQSEICFSYRSVMGWFEGKATDWLLALFTFVLAWKTWGLHSATRGLQGLAAVQGEDMKSSIAQATRAADAAAANAESVKKSLDITVATQRASSVSLRG